MQAVQETNGRKIKVATDIEDLIFDYFCIISVQYELSNKKLEDDEDYMRQRRIQQEEIRAEFLQTNEKKELDMQTATQLAKRINEFTTKILYSQQSQAVDEEQL